MDLPGLSAARGAAQKTRQAWDDFTKSKDPISGTMNGLTAIVNTAIAGLAFPLLAGTEIAGRLAGDITATIATLAGADNEEVGRLREAAVRGGSLEPLFSAPANIAVVAQHYINNISQKPAEELAAAIPDTKDPYTYGLKALLTYQFTPEQNKAAEELVGNAFTLAILPKSMEVARAKGEFGKASTGERLLGLEEKPSSVEELRNQIQSGLRPSFKTSEEQRISVIDRKRAEFGLKLRDYTPEDIQVFKEELPKLEEYTKLLQEVINRAIIEENPGEQKRYTEELQHTEARIESIKKSITRFDQEQKELGVVPEPQKTASVLPLSEQEMLVQSEKKSPIETGFLIDEQGNPLPHEPRRSAQGILPEPGKELQPFEGQEPSTPVTPSRIVNESGRPITSGQSTVLDEVIRRVETEVKSVTEPIVKEEPIIADEVAQVEQQLLDTHTKYEDVLQKAVTPEKSIEQLRKDVNEGIAPKEVQDAYEELHDLRNSVTVKRLMEQHKAAVSKASAEAARLIENPPNEIVKLLQSKSEPITADYLNAEKLRVETDIKLMQSGEQSKVFKSIESAQSELDAVNRMIEDEKFYRQHPELGLGSKDINMGADAGLLTLGEMAIRAARPLLEKIKSEFDSLVKQGKLRADQNEEYFRRRFNELLSKEPPLRALSSQEKDELYKEVLRSAREHQAAEKGRKKIKQKAAAELSESQKIREQINKNSGIPEDQMARINKQIDALLAEDKTYGRSNSGKLAYSLYSMNSSMAREYGAPGGELSTRAALANAQFEKMVAEDNTYIQNAIDAWEKFDTAAKRAEAGKRIQQALENRKDAESILATPEEQKIYSIALKILDRRKEWLKQQGKPFVEDYFTHARDTALKAVNLRMTDASPFFKNRSVDSKAVLTDIPGFLRWYSRSTAREIAFGDIFDYYQSQFMKDVPTLLQKNGTKMVDTFMDALLYKEPVRGNSLLSIRGLTKGDIGGQSTLLDIRRRLSRAYISWNPKSIAQNAWQTQFAWMLSDPRTKGLVNSLSNKEITGRLADAIEEVKTETPRMAQVMSEGMLEIRSKDEPLLYRKSAFAFYENRNWKKSEAAGIINRVLRTPEFQKAIDNGSTVNEAANLVLANPKIFHEAVNEGTQLAAHTQNLPSPAFRGALYNNRMFATIHMFTSFNWRALQIMNETFGTKYGVDSIWAQQILRRGLSEDANVVESLRGVESMYKKVEQMYEDSKAGRNGVDKTLAKQYYSQWKEAFTDLDQTVKERSGIKSPLRMRANYMKYMAIMSGISILSAIMRGQLDPNSDEEGQASKFFSTLANDIPFLTVAPRRPPLLPNIATINSTRANTREAFKWGTAIFLPPVYWIDQLSGNAIENAITDVVAPKENE